MGQTQIYIQSQGSQFQQLELQGGEPGFANGRSAGREPGATEKYRGVGAYQAQHMSMGPEGSEAPGGIGAPGSTCRR